MTSGCNDQRRYCVGHERPMQCGTKGIHILYDATVAAIVFIGLSVATFFSIILGAGIPDHQIGTSRDILFELWYLHLRRADY